MVFSIFFWNILFKVLFLFLNISIRLFVLRLSMFLAFLMFFRLSIWSWFFSSFIRIIIIGLLINNLRFLLIRWLIKNWIVLLVRIRLNTIYHRLLNIIHLFWVDTWIIHHLWSILLFNSRVLLIYVTKSIFIFYLNILRILDTRFIAIKNTSNNDKYEKEYVKCQDNYFNLSISRHCNDYCCGIYSSYG